MAQSSFIYLLVNSEANGTYLELLMAIRSNTARQRAHSLRIIIPATGKFKHCTRNLGSASACARGSRFNK